MGELGERLTAAREARELTLDQVAEATRIPVNYLEALENEDLDVFTSDLHARGFLRNYASWIGLDPDQWVDAYNQLVENPRARMTRPTANTVAARANRTPAPQASSRRTATSKESTGRASTLAVDALLAIVLIAIVGLGAFTIYQRQDGAPVTPTAGLPPTPTATPLPVYEGTEYTMDVFLNYEEHKLRVKERIDYTNVTSETLPNLMLNVHPNHIRGAFKLNDIKVDVEGELVQPEVNLLDVTLRVDLPQELPPSEHVALYLEYALELPKINPGEEFNKASFGYSRRSVSLGNWYPVLAPYREDRGWYGLKYFSVGDPYVTEVADYHVTITTTQEVTIAGTGQETRAGNRWEYEIEKARSFAFAASDHYEVSSTQVGDVTVYSYHFPTDAEAGEVALETATQAIELFTELYGPYPYLDYRVAETEFAGGMEFTGLTFLGSAFYEQYDGTTRTPLIPLAAHEVSHQWFYGLVGNDQLAEPWLDEAIAEYSGYLYYERYLPADVEWWWFYAVDQWVPTGKIDALIYEFRDNREYLDAVYRRGAQFMQDLRETMGDPAFFAFLQEYQRRNAYQLVQSPAFFSLLQELTTADLVPLQEEYFRKRILP